MGGRLTVELTPENVDSLGEPLDAGRRRFEFDSGLLVVLRHPTGAEPDLHPTRSQELEGEHLLREQRGMPEVVVKDERPEVQLGGDGSCGSDGRDRCQRRAPEVIAQEQGRESVGLHLANVPQPAGA